MLYDMVTEFIGKKTNDLNSYGHTGFRYILFVFIIFPILFVVVLLDIILLPIEFIIWCTKIKNQGDK